MAEYVSIRGWIECDFSYISEIKVIVNSYTIKNCQYDIKKDVAELYNSGWHFPTKPLNWTCYVFFGADIKSYQINYIKDQLIEIASLSEEFEGIFYVDYSEASTSLIWELINKELIETNRVARQ